MSRVVLQDCGAGGVILQDVSKGCSRLVPTELQHQEGTWSKSPDPSLLLPRSRHSHFPDRQQRSPQSHRQTGNAAVPSRSRAQSQLSLCQEQGRARRLLRSHSLLKVDAGGHCDQCREVAPSQVFLQVCVCSCHSVASPAGSQCLSQQVPGGSEPRTPTGHPGPGPCPGPSQGLTPDCSLCPRAMRAPQPTPV